MLTLYNSSRIEVFPRSLIREVFGQYQLQPAIKTSETTMIVLRDYLNGREVCGFITRILNRIFTNVSVDRYPNSPYFRVGTSIFKELTTENRLRVRTKQSTFNLAEFAVELFSFLSDFHEEFPSREIEVPFTDAEYRAALRPLTSAEPTTRLRDCYECVCFLNPKRNTYYLDFDLTDMTKEELITIASRFTAEEKSQLYTAGTFSRLDTFGASPALILSYGSLAYSSAVCKQYKLCQELFPEHKIWRLLHLISEPTMSPEEYNLVLDQLLHDDWSEVFCEPSQENIISQFIMRSIIMNPTTRLTWDEAGVLLALIGLKSAYFMNESLPSILECKLPPGNEFRDRLGSLYPGVWDWKIYESMRQELIRIV